MITLAIVKIIAVCSTNGCDYFAQAFSGHVYSIGFECTLLLCDQFDVGEVDFIQIHDGSLDCCVSRVHHFFSASHPWDANDCDGFRVGEIANYVDAVDNVVSRRYGLFVEHVICPDHQQHVIVCWFILPRLQDYRPVVVKSVRDSS